MMRDNKVQTILRVDLSTGKTCLETASRGMDRQIHRLPGNP